jgi:hypothetical protein
MVMMQKYIKALMKVNIPPGTNTEIVKVACPVCGGDARETLDSVNSGGHPELGGAVVVKSISIDCWDCGYCEFNG